MVGFKKTKNRGISFKSIISNLLQGGKKMFGRKKRIPICNRCDKKLDINANDHTTYHFRSGDIIHLCKQCKEIDDMYDISYQEVSEK